MSLSYTARGSRAEAAHASSKDLIIKRCIHYSYPSPAFSHACHTIPYPSPPCPAPGRDETSRESRGVSYYISEPFFFSFPFFFLSFLLFAHQLNNRIIRTPCANQRPGWKQKRGQKRNHAQIGALQIGEGRV